MLNVEDLNRFCRSHRESANLSLRTRCESVASHDMKASPSPARAYGVTSRTQCAVVGARRALRHPKGARTLRSPVHRLIWRTNSGPREVARGSALVDHA